MGGGKEIYDYVQAILKKQRMRLFFVFSLKQKHIPKKKKKPKPTTSLQQEVYND